MFYSNDSRVTPSEYESLMSYAGQAEKGIVEIGVYRGGTTEGFAQVAKEGVPVFGIDNFSYNRDWMKTPLEIFDSISVYKKSFLILGDSSTLGKHWFLPIDFLFIDGDHTYLECKRDALLWEKNVFIGGILAFHDTAFCEVDAVVNEMLESGRFELIEKVDTIKFLRKIAG
jgi:predicted O-methyltransferase YrrM